LQLVDIFLKYLLGEGVQQVFGIPGGLLHPFFDAIEKDKNFDLLVAKHEGGAAFMADGFARAGGGLPVVAATSGPGATNLITGVACAFADGVPMLVITGQASSHSLGKGAAQETTAEDIDIVGMFRPITKYSAFVAQPERLTHHLRRAMRHVHSGRPGPVHLNVPVDFWRKEIDEEWFNPLSYKSSPALFDRDRVQEAASMLMNASNPVLLVGSGAGSDNARKHILSLAEGLGAYVATTPRAKGIFPEDHRLSLGVFGFAGHRRAKKYILEGNVDVVFTIGTSLGETATFNWDQRLTENRKLMHLDIDIDRIGRNYPVDVSLVGDAGTVLYEILHHTKQQWERSVKVPGEQYLDHGIVEERYDFPNLRASMDVPLKPQRWRYELSDVLPENAIIFSDIGGHMLFNVHHLLMKSEQDFYLNLGFGSMGHGTVAPIGAKLACPRRAVIAIIGDACLTMNGMELLCAVENDIPVVWIVEDNQMHGITYHGSKLVSGSPMKSIVLKKPLDLHAMAEAMGLFTQSVSKPGEIAQALSHALESRKASMIIVKVDPNVSPPLGDRAKAVEGFKNE